jgi:hypothetical protein
MHQGRLTMRSKRPRQASPDQVSITREGDVAVIENADPSISVVRLTVGPDLGSMSDAAILDLFNDVIEAQEKLASKYEGIIRFTYQHSGYTFDPHCERVST